MNFLLITYNFLIAQVPLLSVLFPSLIVFVVTGVLVYVPLAILVGHFHTKKQMSVDMAIQSRINPVTLEILERLERIEKAMTERE